MAKSGEEVAVKGYRFFSAVIGGDQGQMAPAELKRKMEEYLNDGWQIIHTMLKDDGKGINVYHVFIR